MAKLSARNAVILINGYNFSTYFTSFDVEADAGKVNVTGFTDGADNFIPGMPTAKISGNVLWDKDTDKTHLALSPRPIGYVSILPEGVAGTASVSLPFMLGNYGTKGAPGGAIEIGALNFESYGNNFGIENGYALAHGTITNTTTGTGVLDDANSAVTADCSATLHVWTACASDTYAVKVQHSTSLGSGYADLITFTLNGSSIGAERIALASGTINKYRRVVATRTGSAGNSFGYSVVFQHQ